MGAAWVVGAHRAASSSFFEKKEPKKRLRRFARVRHRPQSHQNIKVFLLLFVHKKKCLLASPYKKKAR
jgi:hypothetical protein